MEFANANKLCRKSAGSPTIAFAESISEPMSHRVSLRKNRPVAIRCCYDKVPKKEALTHPLSALLIALPLRIGSARNEPRLGYQSFPAVTQK
jgi:hypothetical protein